MMLSVIVICASVCQELFQSSWVKWTRHSMASKVERLSLFCDYEPIPTRRSRGTSTTTSWLFAFSLQDKLDYLKSEFHGSS